MIIHSGRSLEGTEGGQSYWDGYCWILRGDHARRSCHEEEMARSPQGSRKRLFPSQHRFWLECPSGSRKIRKVSRSDFNFFHKYNFHLNFFRYFDVETRLVPVKEENGFIMDPPDAIQYIDENTIGVIVILGSTYTGHFENVQLMSDLCKSSGCTAFA